MYIKVLIKVTKNDLFFKKSNESLGEKTQIYSQ